MQNKKSRYVQTSVFFLIICILAGCSILESDKEYCQLNQDEISHLYFDKDSLVYDGNSINYYDTIAFLHNSMDSMLFVVHTYIYSYSPPYDSYHPSIYGTSTVYFNVNGFRLGRVTAKKELGYNNALITMDFLMIDGGITDVILNKQVDTALVLGKTYNNVYKLEYPENSPSKLKSIYFAKKFGFIKVETADGRKLEKLDLSKEEIRTMESN